MSIAAAKRRRKQHAVKNRHLAKIGRPGVPKKISAEKSARRLSALIHGERTRMHRQALSSKK